MFKTKEINELYTNNDYKIIYEYLHNLEFQNAYNKLTIIHSNINDLQSQYLAEFILNDIFLLKQILSFHNHLVKFWEEICNAKYSSSWNYLQNCLDSLRSINKFALNNQKTDYLNFFEKQLLILEKLYPYNIFLSTGMEVGFYECSICGKNIDSFECEHEIGELYSGEIAIAIAKGVVNLDHVAMVKHPNDKRCVIQYDDNSDQFMNLQFLNREINRRKVTPITIYDADETPKKEINKKYVKLKRNEKCFCGSNKKFKNCCINKQFIEKEHIHLVIKPDFKLW